jgi:LPXTG-motif cell wall-anchored protein
MKFSAIKATLVLCLGGALVAALAPPALAHDSLKSSSPARNAVVSTLDRIELEFSAHVTFPVVILHDTAGRRFESGTPRTDGPKVIQSVAGPLPSGNYVVAWRIVSSDGHPVEGEIPFTVKAASGGAAGPVGTPSTLAPLSATAISTSATADDKGSNSPLLLWGGLALLVIAGGAALFGRRKKPEHPADPERPAGPERPADTA